MTYQEDPYSLFPEVKKEEGSSSEGLGAPRQIKERERETERQRDGETERQRDRETERE